AALIRIGAPQCRPIDFSLIFRGQGAQSFNLETIASFGSFNEFVRFREEEVCIDCEDAKLGIDTCRDINQNHTFYAKARCHLDTIAEGLERPLQQLLDTPTLGWRLRSFHDLVHTWLLVTYKYLVIGEAVRHCWQHIDGGFHLELNSIRCIESIAHQQQRRRWQ